MVVDIGGGTTSITAFSDGAIAYSGVIPIGARNVTNDLAIGLRVSLESAEKIKLLLGTAPKIPALADEEEGGKQATLLLPSCIALEDEQQPPAAAPPPPFLGRSDAPGPFL